MSEDTKFWMLFVVLLFLVLPMIVSSCTIGTTRHDNATMLEMVKSGASPHEARCAVKTCNTYAAPVTGVQK